MRRIFLQLLLLVNTLMANAITVNIGGINYNLFPETGTAEVARNLSGSCAGSVVIPSNVFYDNDNYTVIGIGQSAFHECFNITDITLPNTLSYIGDKAFYWCFQLSSVVVPDNVNTIGNLAFQYCKSMTSVKFGSGLESIGEQAFQSCFVLENIALPNSLKTIGRLCFHECNKLTEVAFPKSITTIGEEAFLSCENLHKVIFEDADLHLDRDVFWTAPIHDFYSMIRTPKDIDAQAFSRSTEPGSFNGAKLYVPKGTKELYKTAIGWNVFANIVEVDDETSPEAEPYAVYNNGTLTFYCDNQRSSREGTKYDLNTGHNEPGWYNDCESISKAVFDVSFANYRPTSTAYWFHSCNNLTTINGIENLKTDNVTSMRDMFVNCSSLTSLDVSGFKTDNVTSMFEMFYLCSKLTNLDVSNFKTANVTDMQRIFGECSSLTSLDVSHFNTANVTDMTGMFKGCSSLTSLDLSGFKTGNVTIMYRMFDRCYNLTTIFAGDDWSTEKETSGRDMFFGCYKLVGGNGTTYDANHVGVEYARIDKPGTPGYFTQKGGNEPQPIDNIVFADAKVKEICVSNWDTNGDGELSKAEAEAIKTLSNKFKGSDITSFDELKYFTGLTALEDNAFTGCTKLTSLTIPKNVASIGESVFASCSSLTSLTVDDDSQYFTAIDGVLYNKSKSELIVCLASKSGALTVDQNCLTIADNAFYECNKLTAITLPAKLTTIKAAVFVGCSSLTTLHIPAKVSYIGMGGFTGCTNLASITVDAGNTTFNSDNGVLYNKQTSTLLAYPNKKGKAYTIAEGTKGIEAFAFCMTDIESVKLPATVTKFGSYALGYCQSLTEVTVRATKPEVLPEDVFSKSSYTDATLYVPAGTKSLYEQTDGWKNFKNIVEMDDDAPSDAEPYAVLSSDGKTVTFYYDGYKDSRGGIDIKSSYGNSPYGTAVTAVIDASFASYLPTSTEYWFSRCYNLTTINGIENLKTDNVTSMLDMFYDCSSLTSLDVSGFKTDNVKNMNSMFKDCNSLTGLDVSNFKTDKVINMNYMFEGCSSLTSLDVSGFKTDNVTIMYGMFKGCSSLTSLDVSSFKTDNVTTMYCMFYGCSGLTSIYAGDGWSTEKVTNGDDMFTDCTKLVGGNGTTYDTNHVDVEYARIDKPNAPGYFTLRGGNEPAAPKLEVDARILNAVSGVVYDEKISIYSEWKNVDEEDFSGEIGWMVYAMENGKWTKVGGITNSHTLKAGSTGNTDISGYYRADGQYKVEWVYKSDGADEFTVAATQIVEKNENGEWQAITMNRSDMMTYCDARDLDFSHVEGLKAYIAAGFNTATGEALMMRVGDVPAGTGLLLVGEYLKCYLVPRQQSPSIYVNLLKGVLERTEISSSDGDYTNYYFSTYSKTFNHVNSNTYVYRHEAYLQIPSQAAGSRQSISLRFDETDGIVSQEQDGQPFDVYSLSGVLLKRGVTSLRQMPRGVYIVSGRKVVVK